MNNVLNKYMILNREELKSLNDFILENAVFGPGERPIENLLETDIGKELLIPKLRKVFVESNDMKYPISIQCWANVFRNSEGTTYHSHELEGVTGYSGHIFISGHKDIGTWYSIDKNGEYVKDENVPGELVLFPMDIPHHVPKNPYDDYRVSIAMDIYPEQIMEFDGTDIRIEGAVGYRNKCVVLEDTKTEEKKIFEVEGKNSAPSVSTDVIDEMTTAVTPSNDIIKQ
jgi:hypothetical protein|tara:strand:- start:682 stop:1365 length:684 start_codon:yes stop_codon:yes gene_type:complete